MFKPTYFNDDEWQTLKALVDRLVPPSADGPGALEADVHEFIDLTMNTPYAYGALWYMQPPFVVSLPEFGSSSTWRHARCTAAPGRA